MGSWYGYRRISGEEPVVRLGSFGLCVKEGMDIMGKAMREFMRAAEWTSRRSGRAVLRMCVAGGCFLLVLPLGAQQRKPAPPPGKRPHFVSLYPSFQLTAVGDAIIVTPTKVHENDPAFMGVVKAVR